MYRNIKTFTIKITEFKIAFIKLLFIQMIRFLKQVVQLDSGSDADVVPR